MEPLTSDELGAVAQSAFKNLCDRAKLVQNDSSRDRTGWDFIVQFPMPVDPAVSLDKRPAGHTCYVQVKGTSRSGQRVDMRLSSAERLAKEANPSFVCVLLLNEQGVALDGFLIHMTGDNLGKLLKRLRRAQADGQPNVNRAKISFAFRKCGVRFEPTPDGLREAFASACGDDPVTYVSRKHREFDELGYGERRLELKATFSYADREELFDFFLGQKPLIPSDFATLEHRFDIALPVDQLAEGSTVELTLVPEPLDTCTVAIRGAPSLPASVFQGRLIAPPPVVRVEGRETKRLIECDDFKLTFRGPRVDFKTNPGLASGSRTAEQWINLFRGMSHLATGEAIITITSTKLPRTIEVPITTRLSGGTFDHIPALMKTVEDGQRLLLLAGAIAASTLTIEDIIEAADAVSLASITMLAAEPEWPFTVDSLSFGEGGPSTFEALYANGVQWAGAWLAYAAKVTFHMVSPEGSWDVRSVIPLNARAWSIDAFDDFIAEQKRRHGLDAVMRPASDAH